MLGKKLIDSQLGNYKKWCVTNILGETRLLYKRNSELKIESILTINWRGAFYEIVPLSRNYQQVLLIFKYWSAVYRVFFSVQTTIFTWIALFNILMLKWYEAMPSINSADPWEHTLIFILIVGFDAILFDVCTPTLWQIILTPCFIFYCS